MGRRGCILVCRLVEFGLSWGICLIDELLNSDFKYFFFLNLDFFFLVDLLFFLFYGVCF